MFGHRYFGAAYYGPRYWGDGGDTPPPVVSGRSQWMRNWLIEQYEREWKKPEPTRPPLPVVEEKLDTITTHKVVVPSSADSEAEALRLNQAIARQEVERQYREAIYKAKAAQDTMALRKLVSSVDLLGLQARSLQQAVVAKRTAEDELLLLVAVSHID